MKSLFVLCTCIFCCITIAKAQNYQQMIKLLQNDRQSQPGTADRAANDYFGRSVAIDGNIAVVGAHRQSSAIGSVSLTEAGAVYVFDKSSGSWQFQQKVVATDRAANDWFGYSVSISGETIVVGAHQEDEDAAGASTLSAAGAVYVFKRTGTEWAQQQKIVPSDRAASDNFGYSVSINGETMVVGAYQQDEGAGGGTTLANAGAAYVFTRSSNTWTQQQKLVAGDRAAGDWFGTSVGISGETIVVGAYFEDHDASGGNVLLSAGSAYVFNRTNTSWIQQQKLVASDRAVSDNFGYSVAVSGETIVVGSYQEDEDANGNNTLNAAGSVYVFTRTVGTWTQQQKLVASDRAVADNFGVSVSISGESIVVGAYLEDEDANGGSPLSAAGSAYVFIRSNSAWTQQQKLTHGDRAVNDQLGFSVAISGEIVLAGAHLENEDDAGNNTLSDAGSAYLFSRTAASWAQSQKIASPGINPSSNQQFAYSVAIDGNTAVVGAFKDDFDTGQSNKLNDAGAAYVFTKRGLIWEFQQKIVASDRGVDDLFGASVAISGQTIVVGAYQEDHDISGVNALADAGSAYVFTRTGSVWTEQQKLLPTDRGINNWFGASVAINGETVVVGAFLADEDGSGSNTVNDAGAIYVFTRSMDAWRQQQKLVASDRAALDHFGKSVAISGETVLVGAHHQDADPTGGTALSGAGAAYVFTRNLGSWAQQQKLVAADRAANDYFGWSVAISGETVVVGAYAEDEDASATPDNTRSNAGSAYVFTRSGSTWTQQQKLVAADRAAIDYFGWSVAISGETIVAGAVLEDEDASATPANTLISSGSAYVFARSGSTWTQQQKLVAADRAASDNFGYSVAISGNIIVAGAPLQDQNANGSFFVTDNGAAYLFEQIYTWSGATSTAWNLATNWQGGTVPTSTSNVRIPAGTSFSPALVANTTIADLQIDSAATLLVGGNKFNVIGALTNNGSITASTGGNLVLSGTDAQTISGKGSIANLELANSNGATIAAESGNMISLTGNYSAAAGTLTTNGNLVFKSTATATAAHLSGTISGNVAVERYLSAKTKLSSASYKSLFLASPVTANINTAGWQQQVHITGGTGLGTAPTGDCATVPSATANQGFDRTQTGNPSLFTYNDALTGGAKWMAASTTNQNLVPGTGYRLVVRGPRSVGCDLINGSAQTSVQAVTLSATGTLAQGDQALPSSGSALFQLVGNPYAAPLNFAALSTAQSTVIEASYWTYNPANANGVYSVYNGGNLTNVPSGYSNDGIIASGQAFFLKRKTGQTGTVAAFFTEAMKSTITQPGMFRTANGDGNTDNQWGWARLLRLRLHAATGASPADSNRLDETIVRFSMNNPAVSDTVLGSLDAQQFSASVSRLSSVKAGQQLSNHTRPVRTSSADTVRLNMAVSGVGNYWFDLGQMVGMQAMEVILRDKHLGTQTPLALNQPVAISVTSNPASQGANRFELIFRSSATLASKFTSIKASRSAALARNEVRFTAQEDGGTTEYQLEASTNGGQSFEAVSGATTPGSRQAGAFSYQLNDERAITATQTVHYRIKAIGNQTSYSQVVKVDADGKQMMTVKAYPNPVKDVLNIQLTGTRGQVDIRLLDVQGRVVLSQRQTVNGQQTISLATKQLAQGKYLLQATGQGGETLATQSIVKE